MNQRVISVWLPDWPIQRLRREHPELAHKPIALSQPDARGERVAACSEEARRLGVRIGAATPEAQAMASDRLCAMPHLPSADRRALESLAVASERFSPTVALESFEEPSALLLDATGLADLWKGEAPLLEEAIVFYRQASLTAIVAIAPTVGMALAASRYGRSMAHRPIVIANADASRFARQLPIDALRLDQETLDRLASLGLLRVGQVLDLPRASLPARFGNMLAERIDQLLGAADEPLESFRGEPPLARQWRFEAAVTSTNVLFSVVEALLGQLGVMMQQRRCGALRVLIALDCEGGAEPITFTLRLFRPTNSAKELTELAVLRMSEARLTRGVEQVRVLIAGVAEVVSRQRQLFEDDPRDDPHELALLINRLANRVGEGNVARILKRRSVTPELSYVQPSAVDTPGQAYRLQPGEAQKLRTRPILLDAISAQHVEVRTNEHGEPVAVGLGGCKSVERVWGPERIESGWWRRRGVRRDQYWVELDGGSRRLIAQDLRTGHWTLLGE